MLGGNYNHKYEQVYWTVIYNGLSENLTYAISNLTQQLTEELINEQIDSAFDIWTKHTKLKWKKVKPDKPCDIKISFCQKLHGDGFDFDGKDGTLAHGYFSGSEIGGDLHFDDSKNWFVEETPPGHNLFVVAVHEIGHCLGLTDLENTDSVMFPSYKHELSKLPKKNILSKYDIE